MAVTKNFDFRMGTHGAPTSLTDLSGVVQNINMPFALDTFETTTANQTDNLKKVETGLSTVDGSGDGLWSAAVEQQFFDLIRNGTEVDYQYGKLGATGGNPKYTGKLVVTNFEAGTEIATQRKFTFSYRVNSVTLGTYA